MLAFTTNQLAEELHTSRNKIDYLRNVGILKSIKMGNGYIFPMFEVDRFLHECMNEDLSNEFTIDNVVAKLERKETNDKQ